MDPVELTDEDLVLRPWRSSDADEVCRACQDPDIQRWTTVPSPYSLDDARAFVANAARRWAAGERAAFGVFDAGTGALLGSVALIFEGMGDGTAGFGYWTAPWARGRGVAERASRRVARWAFGTLRIARLHWDALAGNHTSRLVAARVGVKVEGTLRAARTGGDFDGGRVDVWVGSLLPRDLRDAGPDGAELRRAARQARTFGADQPVLTVGAADDTVTLRPLSDDDVPAMVEMCQDPEMIAFTTVPDPYLPEHAEGFLRYARRGWLSGTGVTYGIEAGGRPSGTVDLRLDQWPARIAEIGYSVAPWARGAGLGSATVRALCAWGFDALALDRIEWRAFTTNLASRRVAEKAGFTVEGTERSRVVHRDGPLDTWYGALLAADL